MLVWYGKELYQIVKEYKNKSGIVFYLIRNKNRAIWVKAQDTREYK